MFYTEPNLKRAVTECIVNRGDNGSVQIPGLLVWLPSLGHMSKCPWNQKLLDRRLDKTKHILEGTSESQQAELNKQSSTSTGGVQPDPVCQQNDTSKLKILINQD